MTTESAIGGCFACEGLPVAPNDPCGMCGRSSKDFKPVKLRGSTTRATENRGLVDLRAAWSCEERDRDGDCRNPYGCHCAEIGHKVARIRELEAGVLYMREQHKAEMESASEQFEQMEALKDTAKARCRKLEEALETAADNFDEIAEAIDGLASAEDRPLGTAELIRAVATEARALLDQADGEEGNG